MKWILMVLWGVFWIKPVTCWAVDGGLLVSPPFVSLTIGGEKEISKELIIRNDSKQPLTFKIRAVDFGTMDESGGVAFLGNDKKEGESKYGLASWLLLEKDALVIDPGKEESLKVTVINKESLSPGGHYGAVWLVLDENGTKKIGLSMSYASLFYVAKMGGAKYGMSLNRAIFDKNWWKKLENIEFRFQNTGNVHLVPRGVVEVFDSFGKKVAKGVINADSTIMLPESFRVYGVKLNNLTRWWPGRYRVEVNYRYDGKSDFEKLEYQGNYWPWWLLSLPVFLVVVFAVMIGRKRRR